MKALLLCVLFTLSLTAHAELLTGHVVSVYDGDTLTAQLSDGKTVKVRLQWIDAPELRQPYGKASRLALAALVNDQDILIDSAGPDRYGRLLGTVYLTVNTALIKQGAAWVYRSYPHPKPLEALETQSQQAQLGLFALPDSRACPPWVYRKTRCTP
jgi:endonuclease YncB( thermonuclease family)